MKKYLKLLRIKHYIKNILIFLPAILSQQLFDKMILYKTMIGMIIFSIISSIIYIINDIRDVDSDRAHPIKSRRPLASGEISVRTAKYLAAALAAAGILAWGAAVPSFDFSYMLIPVVYLAINAAYSLKLKKYPLVDVSILMMGYVLRLMYGGVLAGTGVSAWMFLTITAGAFFMGFGKRRNELLIYGDSGRANLKVYTIEFLDQACLMSMTTTIVFYALSCADVNTAVAEVGVNLLWSVPVVFIICLRYLMILNDGKSDGDPIEVVLKDKWLLMLCAAFFSVLMILLYG